MISFMDAAFGPYALVELVYPGKPSVFVAVGGLPYGRVLLSESCDDVIITPVSAAVAWREVVGSFDAEPGRYV